MRPWAYDENGWPSGFGDGKVMAIYTGNLSDFSGTHQFEPWGSLVKMRIYKNM